MAKKPTIAQMQAQLEAVYARAIGAEQQLEDLRSRIRHDYIERTEYNRVQGVLRSTQQWMRKYKADAQAANGCDARGNALPGQPTAAAQLIRARREQAQA